MLWIAGSIAFVLFGAVVMCILIIGRRADDRIELSKLIDPSIRLPSSAEDKVRIVLEGFKNQIPVSGLRKREGISPALDYSWAKGFIDPGDARLNRGSLRNATQSGAKELGERMT